MRRKGNPPEDGACVSGYVCTIIVDDYDAYAAKILAAGGTEALPKMALVGMAWQGYFKDNDGNIFGLHQPDEKAA